ncbi:family 43 glycosylhydrolase [uncultured Algibacter sp.]|uniref:glycoside hydrolase family 117 protein n=1 Tax=uncultured Algibacter sp. TaxID=298659 RepID=UPI002639FE16|nr:family 43 glycosylhydrolase [uncultured Algibacter sp.]
MSSQSVLIFVIICSTFSYSIYGQKKESKTKLSSSMQRFTGNDSDNELYTRFRYKPVSGLGYEEGVNRRDPSSIIKVGDLYYVWYTHCKDTESSWLNADLWYATSKDGVNWKEQGPAVERGGKGSWDDYSVFTTNILVANGKYYLTYQARTFFEQRNVIGMAWADTPDGPWTKLSNPILRTTPDGKLKNEHKTGFTHVLEDATLEPGSWDSGAVHDPGVIVRNGKYYLYYKGHAVGEKMYSDSKWGVAISDSPEGPYIKSPYNPVTNSGHEIWVFPWKSGIAAIVDWAGPEKGTVQYSEDGLNFEVITVLEDIPPAGGAYIADKFLDTKNGKGFDWGLCHYGRSNWTFLVRFECDLKQDSKKNLDWGQFKHYSTIRDVMLYPEKYGVTSEILQKKRN